MLTLPESPGKNPDKTIEFMGVKVSRKMAMTLGLLIFTGMVFVGPAAAVDINWTEISDMITGVADIVPGISSLAIAVVPLIILFSVIGFVTGFFDSLIQGITSALKFR